MGHGCWRKHNLNFKPYTDRVFSDNKVIWKIETCFQPHKQKAAVFVLSVQNFLLLLSLIVAWSWLFLFCCDQAAETAKQPLSPLSWFATVAASFLHSVSCTVMISRYLNAAYTNRSADYLCFTLINMWGHQCKRWLQSPASLVAMKQNHTRLCMCKDSLEAFLSPSL